MKTSFANDIEKLRGGAKALKAFFYREIKNHDCPHCGALIFDKNGMILARGYNHLCRQTDGDRGWYCESCRRVHFKTTLEEHLKTLPNWCSCEGHVGQSTPQSGFTEYNERVLEIQREYASQHKPPAQQVLFSKT